MDRNFFLAAALSILVLVAWQAFFAPPPPEPETRTAETARPSESTPAVPSGVPPAPSEPGPAPPLDPGPAVAAEESVPERRVTLATELWEAEFTSHGGALVHWRLRQYDDASQPGRPLVDMVTLGDVAPAALLTPFEELGSGDLSRAAYQVEQPDATTLVFSREQRGVRIRKVYSFEDGTYLFRLRLEVENASDRGVRPTFRTTWPAARRESADFREFNLASYVQGDLEQRPIVAGPSFLGFGGGAFEQPEQFGPGIDWAGAQTRYFLAGLLPDLPREASVRFTPLRPGDTALAELAFQPVDLPAGQRIEREVRVYLGPKETDRLDSVGGHLDEAILRGWFPSLTRFFTWALTATHGVVPNYGVAIILITAVVRLLMAPIMARQMRSMKRMAELQPKVREVQQKYPDDRQKQSEAMMAVYREAGMNPLSTMAGCFPMLLQLPVFIGFYYALQGAIQLRQQPFFGWITDLSEPETLFVIPGLELPVRLLPLLMGGSMVAQQKLTPTAMDPAQARMMLTVMPIMFTLLFYQFASGLVLYWLVSNLLGIAQQAITNRERRP